MSRWVSGKGEVDTPKMDAFIEELIAVGKKHGFVISHEDGHGAFIVRARQADDYDFDGWLREAHVEGEPS